MSGGPGAAERRGAGGPRPTHRPSPCPRRRQPDMKQRKSLFRKSWCSLLSARFLGPPPGPLGFRGPRKRRGRRTEREPVHVALRGTQGTPEPPCLNPKLRYTPLGGAETRAGARLLWDAGLATTAPKGGVTAVTAVTDVKRCPQPRSWRKSRHKDSPSCLEGADRGLTAGMSQP